MFSPFELKTFLCPSCALSYIFHICYIFHRCTDELVKSIKSRLVGPQARENGVHLYVSWLNITFKIQTLIVNLRLTFLELIMYLSIRNTCYSAKKSIRRFGSGAKNSGAKREHVFTLSPSCLFAPLNSQVFHTCLLK